MNGMTILFVIVIVALSVPYLMRRRARLQRQK